MNVETSSASASASASAREAARYLSQRGYQHASELLSGAGRPSEIEVKDLLRDELASAGPVQRRKDARLALHVHPDPEGAGYAESFEQLSEWLASSAESLQRELKDFRFPLLLHCFIALASRGDMEQARSFLKEHVPSLASESQKRTAASLSELQHATQVAQHEATRQYLVHRTMLFCSPDAWEALCGFLVASRLLLLLRLLIKFFDVHAIATQPPLVPPLVSPAAAQKQQPQPQQPQQHPQSAAASAAPAASVAAGSSSAHANASRLPPPPRSSTAPPSVCVVTQACAYTQLCCSELPPSADALVCGRADGAIQLCRFLRSDALQSRFAASAAELHSRSRVLHGHAGPVYSVALSHDQEFVLSGSQDGAVRLWSWRHGAALAAYRNHGYPVWHVAFASHHSQFLSSCYDGGLRLFDTQRLAPLRLMAGHLADVTAARFHPSDAYAVSASQDGTLRLWDVSSSGCVRLLLGHTGPVCDVAIAPGAEVAASASADQTVRLWDLGSGRVKATLPHAEPVTQVVFSSDGRLLASVSAKRLRIWSWEAAIAASGVPEPLLCCDSAVPLLGAAFMLGLPVLLACGVGDDPLVAQLA